MKGDLEHELDFVAMNKSEITKYFSDCISEKE